MIKNSMFCIGLDLGDKHSYVAVLDQDGELIEEARLPTNKTSFQRKFSSLQRCRVAMEVGSHSRWVSHMLKDMGHDVLVANARKLRAIYHNPRKGDRADAETLARLARLDPELLSPIHHRSPQAQVDLAVMRSRDAIVRSRTLLINHTRGTVKTFGSRLPSCSADSFARKVAPDIPEPLQPALAPVFLLQELSDLLRSHPQRPPAFAEPPRHVFDSSYTPRCSQQCPYIIQHYMICHPRILIIPSQHLAPHQTHDLPQIHPQLLVVPGP
jgi:transposase